MQDQSWNLIFFLDRQIFTLKVELEFECILSLKKLRVIKMWPRLGRQDRGPWGILGSTTEYIPHAGLDTSLTSTSLIRLQVYHHVDGRVFDCSSCPIFCICWTYFEKINYIWKFQKVLNSWIRILLLFDRVFNSKEQRVVHHQGRCLLQMVPLSLLQNLEG